MTDFIVRRNSQIKFTHLSNELLQKSNLSFKSLGMLVYLLSLPRDWRLNMEHLVKQGSAKSKHGCGRDAIKSIIKELQEEGYLKIVKSRDKGKFLGSIWYLNEEPNNNQNPPDPPQVDFPLTVNPSVEKPPLQIRSYSKGLFNKLLLPPDIDEKQRTSLLKIVAGLPIDQAQNVLDEVIGLKRAGRIKSDLVSLAHGLVKKVKTNTFNISVGLSIRQERLRHPPDQISKSKLTSLPDTPGSTKRPSLREMLAASGIILGSG